MADIKIYGTLKNVTNEPIANAEQIGNLATVATSGSYNDLRDKPTIPSKTSELNNDSKFVSEYALTKKQDVLTVPYVADANFSAIVNAYYNLLKFNNLIDASIELPQNAKVNTDVIIFLFRTGTPRQDETLNINFYCNGYSTIFPSGFEFEPATTYEIEFRRTNTYEWNPVKINNLTKYIKVPTSISQLLEDSKHRTITDDEKSDYTYAAEQFIKYGIINLTNEISKWEYGTTVNVAYDGLFVFENYFIANTTGMVPINVYVNLKRNNETIYLIDKQIPTYSHIILNESFNVKEGDIITFQCSDSFGIKSENKAYLKYIVSKKNLPTKTSELTNDSGFLTQHQDISGKQDVLISGTNIKTINNNSIVGSGNLSVGTVTGVKINNITKTPTNGTVDLGTVLTSTTSSVANGSKIPITSGGVDSALRNYETRLVFTTSGSTSYTAQRNKYCRFSSTLPSLGISLPTSSLVAGDTCAFNFTTSSSFSSFTITGGTIKKMKDFAIEANKTYEVVALYDGVKWLVTATEFE